MKNWLFTLKFAKTNPIRGIFDVCELRVSILEVDFANLRVKRKFLVNRAPKFVINDPKNLLRSILDFQIPNTSKIILFKGSFCNFKSAAPISHRKDP